MRITGFSRVAYDRVRGNATQTDLVDNQSQHLGHVPADLVHGHRPLLDDGVQELEGAALEGERAAADEQRPEEDAERVQVRALVLGRRLHPASLLGGCGRLFRI